jgi:predicted nuclease of restriction endonuclease-like RecB superfamily
VLIEIAGFWTPEYLRRKIERLRSADLPPFVLCIDDQRACGQADLPLDLAASVVRFRRRLDAATVLRAVLRLTAGPDVKCFQPAT